MLNLKNISDEVESVGRLSSTFGPFFRSKSSEVFLLICIILCVMGIFQIYYVTAAEFSRNVDAIPNQLFRQFFLLIIGGLTFVIVQTKTFVDLVEYLAIKPRFWIAAANTLAFFALFGYEENSVSRYFDFDYFVIDNGPLVCVLVIAFFTSLGEGVKRLSIKDRVIYSALGFSLLIIANIQPHLPLIKSLTVICFMYLTLYGLRKVAVEVIAVSAIVSIGYLVFVVSNYYDFDAERLFSYLNYEDDPYYRGYQTRQAIVAWVNADYFRFGLKNTKFSDIPDVLNAMSFSATVQLWGVIGVLSVVFLSLYQFLLLLNGTNTCISRKLAVFAIGVNVVCLQGIISSYLNSIGMLPPSYPIGGSGFFSLGFEFYFAFFAAGLSYKVLTYQERGRSDFEMALSYKTEPSSFPSISRIGIVLICAFILLAILGISIHEFGL